MGTATGGVSQQTLQSPFACRVHILPDPHDLWTLKIRRKMPCALSMGPAELMPHW